MESSAFCDFYSRRAHLISYGAGATKYPWTLAHSNLKMLTKTTHWQVEYYYRQNGQRQNEFIPIRGWACCVGSKRDLSRTNAIEFSLREYSRVHSPRSSVICSKRVARGSNRNTKEQSDLIMLFFWSPGGICLEWKCELELRSVDRSGTETRLVVNAVSLSMYCPDEKLDTFQFRRALLKPIHCLVRHRKKVYLFSLYLP